MDETLYVVEWLNRDDGHWRPVRVNIPGVGDRPAVFFSFNEATEYVARYGGNLRVRLLESKWT